MLCLHIILQVLLLFNSSHALSTPAKEKSRKQEIRRKLAHIGRHEAPQPYHKAKTSSTAKESGETYYSTTWAGAGFPNQVGISQISGTFVVPNVTLAKGDTTTGTYSGAAFIGIDGLLNQCNNLFMLGAIWNYNDGTWNYAPFYFWDPSDFEILDFSITPGETLQMHFSTTGGVNSTGGNWSFKTTKPGSKKSVQISGSISGQAPLCQETAQWITSTNQSGAEMLDFGTIQFSGAEYVALGNGYGPGSGADIFEIVGNNNVAYTSCAATGTFDLSCSYGS